uniref:NAD-dependent epimerase/dehydratase family protein n=1 Tax=Chryseobacterium endophyticum TaxID=1854762 RepID=A0AAU6WNI9_9FLAO
MKIIITGSSGFVGKNLSYFLQSKGYTLNNLSLRNKDWKTYFPKSADAIIHLAGKAHDTKNTSNPDEYYKVNRDLTIALFDEFLNSEIKEFFYFSSVKAAADSVSGILTEDEKADPMTHYGKSKIEAEEYILNQNLPEGKKYISFVPV